MTESDQWVPGDRGYSAPSQQGAGAQPGVSENAQGQSGENLRGSGRDGTV